MHARSDPGPLPELYRRQCREGDGRRRGEARGAGVELRALKCFPFFRNRGTLVIAMTDARNRRVFSTAYYEGREIMPEEARSIDEFARLIGEWSSENPDVSFSMKLCGMCGAPLRRRAFFRGCGRAGALRVRNPAALGCFSGRGKPSGASSGSAWTGSFLPKPCIRHTARKRPRSACFRMRRCRSVSEYPIRC